MKKYLIGIAVGALFLFSSGSAMANTNHSGFGLGVMVGEPTGLSGKLWSGGSNAFDFGLAWSTRKNANITFHMDYVRCRFNKINVGEGNLPLYYGIGVRLRERDDIDDNIGIRFPLGLDYLFADSAIEVFLEVVPILELVPDSDFDISAGLGIRYFF